MNFGTNLLTLEAGGRRYCAVCCTVTFAGLLTCVTSSWWAVLSAHLGTPGGAHAQLVLNLAMRAAATFRSDTPGQAAEMLQHRWGWQVKI